MYHLQKKQGSKWLFSVCHFTTRLKSNEATESLRISTFFFSREYFDNHNSLVSYSSDTESDTEFHFPGCQIAYYLYRSLTHMSANSLTPNHENIWGQGKLDGRAEETVELNCLFSYCTPAENRWVFCVSYNHFPMLIFKLYFLKWGYLGIALAGQCFVASSPCCL